MNLALTKTQVGSIFAVTAAFLFSTKAIFIKQAYELSPLVDGTVLMALRMLSALPFFLLLAWFNRANNKNIVAKDWGILVVAGLIGYYLSSWLDFAGLMYISASLERIILFLSLLNLFSKTISLIKNPRKNATTIAIIIINIFFFISYLQK